MLFSMFVFCLPATPPAHMLLQPQRQPACVLRLRLPASHLACRPACCPEHLVMHFFSIACSQAWPPTCTVSCPQVDTADRGFSFLREGPLDMRMDPGAALSAEQLVNTWPEAELGRVLREYGEERYWKSIARRWVPPCRRACLGPSLQRVPDAPAGASPGPGPGIS